MGYEKDFHFRTVQELLKAAEHLILTGRDFEQINTTQLYSYPTNPIFGIIRVRKSADASELLVWLTNNKIKPVWID